MRKNLRMKERTRRCGLNNAAISMNFRTRQKHRTHRVSTIYQLAIYYALFLQNCHAFHFRAPRVLNNHVVGFFHSSATDHISETVSVPHVVVVGGGVGGLAIASRLAHTELCRVTILEKNDHLGGRCGSFNVTIPEFGTFRHERGPSLLLLPRVYRELFHDCNSSPQDCGLEIVQCVPAYQVVFDDGDRLEVGFPRTGESLSAGEIKSRKSMDSFERNGSSKWDQYMQVCEAFLDCGLPNFIEQRLDLSSFPAFVRESLRDFGKSWPLKPHSDVLDALFESDKMKALASFQDLYVGLEPYRNPKLPAGGVFDSTAPAVFGLLAAIELHPCNHECGVFAPIGGFQRVTESFERLALGLGVSIRRNTMVTKVTDEGVYYHSSPQSSSATFLPADLVVINADLLYARASLLDKKSDPAVQKYDWLQRSAGRPPFRFSSGVIAFRWSLCVEASELKTHNVFLSTASRSDAEASWKVVRENVQPGVRTPFNFYVHRASSTDPDCAPKVRRTTKGVH